MNAKIYECKIGYNGLLWVETNTVTFEWIYISYLAGMINRCDSCVNLNLVKLIKSSQKLWPINLDCKIMTAWTI